MAEPSILGALRDPQFRSDTLRNLVEALNGAQRSLTVGSLGAVGDMGNTLANLVRAGVGTAYHEATGRPIPQALEYRDPARDFGTSASLGNFAESQGWLPPQTFSMPEQAGALLGPIVAMKAPDLAQSTLRGLVSALKSEPSRRMVEGLVDGMGARPKIFAGEGAKTADMQALAKAQQLEKAGAPERAIWSDTGWFKGADGKWRFEIDDSGARLRDYNFTPQEAFQNTPYADRAEMAPYAGKSKTDLVSEYKRTGGLIADAATRGDTDKAMQMLQDRAGLDKLFEAMRSRTYGPASSFMAHGELGAAYPDVYKLHTRIDNDLSGMQGQYLRGDRTQGEQIVLGSKPKWSDGKSTLLHELQHAVQQREGFARGGSPSQFTQLPPDFRLTAQQLISVDETAKRLGESVDDVARLSLEPTLAQRVNELVKSGQWDANVNEWRQNILPPQQQYERLAGEAEARAVQSRMNMTPTERRATFPFDSYDVPRDKLILRDLLKGPAEATVWHGSPHQFDAFDSSKIGTGEGAQAYGHGLYLAEAVDTAKTYRDKLAGTSKFNVTGTTPNAKQFANSGILNGELWELKDAFLRNGGDINKTASDLKQTAEWSSNKNGLLNIAGMVERGELVPNLPDPLGSLYKVDLPDPLIARMLDWDKPLSQQAPEVKNAFRNVPAPGQGMTYGDIVDAIDAAPHLQNANDYPWAHPSGSELYRVFGEGLMTGNNSKGQAAASTKLRELGIPGIRYLDGGSRADGAGTSNFVVFPGEESALTILERNGKPVRR